MPFSNHSAVRSMKLVLTLAVIATTIATALPYRTLVAQGQPAAIVGPTAAELQPAAAAFAQGDWKVSLDAYSSLAARYPAHPLSRFRVGVSLVGLGRFAEGEASLREGERMGIPPGNAAYRLAQALTGLKKRDEAIAELLRAAATRTPVAPSTIAADPLLTPLTSHPKWQSVLDAFDAVARPCMHDKRYREFDFWIGDWDVRPTGTPAVGPPARNTVTLDNNGCVVTEHWKAPGGSEGQSFNLFDRSLGVWRQTWVDNVGGQFDYRGGLVAGNMVYLGENPLAGAQAGRGLARLTFFNISRDSVRQFGEQSTDSGKTWATTYDLMYVRRKPE